MEPTGAPWRVLDSTETQETPAATVAHGRPWLAIGLAVVAVSVAAGALLLAARPGAGVGVDGGTSRESGAVDEGGMPSTVPASRSAVVVVEVGGAVAHPGVYRLAAGSRVGDAIAAAGGFGPRVDAAAADRTLNLASPLVDGTKVHVPGRGEATGSSAAPPGGPSGAPGPAGTQGPRALVDLNRATAEELDALPGIGPATAAKIIAAREQRPFKSVDDLGSRKVLGPSVLAKVRPLVTVGG